VTEAILYQDLSFAYRLLRPAGEPDGAFVLLHGSATDETTLIPLAREIAPQALLLAVRGRIMQDGERRWFRRVTPTSFDQDSIRAEAGAFAEFIPEVAARHGLELSQTVCLGYSNGANLISSVMLLQPGLINRAVLLRAMPVLDTAPTTDLSDAEILIIAGERDQTYAPFAPALVRLLRGRGARVAAFATSAGHEFGATDARIAREWLASRRETAAGIPVPRRLHR
jgi:phospholipase/carboxylesterase